NNQNKKKQGEKTLLAQHDVFAFEFPDKTAQCLQRRVDSMPVLLLRQEEGLHVPGKTKDDELHQPPARKAEDGHFKDTEKEGAEVYLFLDQFDEKTNAENSAKEKCRTVRRTCSEQETP
ncbi:MAG: hypothetical protein II932_05160, partial [Treponema sp.]|nr:hypothetical protein [Treponema sp.]